MMALALGCFFWPSFCSSFTWSQLSRISENARWGSPWTRETPSARFLKFCKNWTRVNSCKKKARKNTLARIPSCPNYDFLKLLTKHNILLQTSPPKVPVEPSYVKFAKGTPSARFLKFCKVGTRTNSCKKKARKNTLARMPSCPNKTFLQVPT